ncbi:MAG: hypothetical protein JO295_11535 [Verrucomicrobia bacterium]|nr:hypothetical protein [Verrucomicrobiota bacterium]
MPIITRYKCKIGAHLSYPCTLTELDGSLLPIAGQNELEVCFRDWDAPRKNEVRERYDLLKADYERRYVGVRAGEWHYTINVHPVPRTMRAHVRGLLFPSGAERLRAWLLADHPPIWYSVPHHFTIRFDATLGSLLCDEYPKA